MKNINHKSNKKGQTLLEIIAVLVIIGVILAGVIPAVSASTDNGRIQSTLSSIRAIQSAAIGYYNDNNGTYASISNTGLIPKYLPNSATGASAGTFTDAWGGTITVAGISGTTNQYTVTLTNVPLTAQSILTKALQNTAIGVTPNGTSYQVTLS